MIDAFSSLESTIEEMLEDLGSSPYYEYFSAVGNGMARITLCDSVWLLAVPPSAF